MINRIRDIRREKGMTLADVAARCKPPTTAQTIGRLETGMRNLSLGWMNKIGAALGVDPELLVRGEEAAQPEVVARLTDAGAEALTAPREAILPTALGGQGQLVALAVEASSGEFRAGDQVWLRHVPEDDWARCVNRDVLVPRPGGRFAFDIDNQPVALFPTEWSLNYFVQNNPNVPLAALPPKKQPL